MEKIMRLIDEETAPDRMSQQAALDFLEQIETEIEMRKDALRDEIESED